MAKIANRFCPFPFPYYKSYFLKTSPQDPFPYLATDSFLIPNAKCIHFPPILPFCFGLTFFSTLLLILVSKCFNFQPVTHQRQQQKIKVIKTRGMWTCLEMFLWSKPHLSCQEIHTSVHWSAAAAQSTYNHFPDIPAVQLSCVGIAAALAQPSRNIQAPAKSTEGTKTTRDARRISQLCLSQQREDQQRHETKKCCKASSTSKPFSQSIETYLQLPSNIMWYSQVLPHHVFWLSIFILAKLHMST